MFPCAHPEHESGCSLLRLLHPAQGQRSMRAEQCACNQLEQAALLQPRAPASIHYEKPDPGSLPTTAAQEAMAASNDQGRRLTAPSAGSFTLVPPCYPSASIRASACASSLAVVEPKG